MPPSGTRVVNLYRDQYDVYIGRAFMAPPGHDGTFGNPHNIGRCIFCTKKMGADVFHTRQRALEEYQEYFADRIKNDDLFRKKVHALRGRVLGCFCAPSACHGQVIIAYLESL
jgi:hypothetical protein